MENCIFKKKEIHRLLPLFLYSIVLLQKAFSMNFHLMVAKYQTNLLYTPTYILICMGLAQTLPHDSRRNSMVI